MFKKNPGGQKVGSPLHRRVPNPFSGNRNAPFGIYWGTKSD
jgi:hypothetical protein